MSNLVALQGMNYVKDKRPYHTVEDSSIAMIWSGRYVFWNLLFWYRKMINSEKFQEDCEIRFAYC